MFSLEQVIIVPFPHGLWYSWYRFLLTICFSHVFKQKLSLFQKTFTIQSLVLRIVCYLSTGRLFVCCHLWDSLFSLFYLHCFECLRNLTQQTRCSSQCVLPTLSFVSFWDKDIQAAIKGRVGESTVFIFPVLTFLAAFQPTYPASLPLHLKADNGISTAQHYDLSPSLTASNSHSLLICTSPGSLSV